MATKAKKGSTTAVPIKAADCTIKDKGQRFYCATKGCEAEMILCKAGNEDAYFKSKHKKDHISFECIKNSIIFNPTNYEETKFSKDDAFEYMFGEKGRTIIRGSSGTKKGVIGRERVAIRTIRNLYAMCISKEKTDTYNGYLIDAMFADDENFARYDGNLEGRILVECSFFKKEYDKNILYFNYPKDFRKPHNIIRLNFQNSVKCWEMYKKYKDASHISPIALAGDWRKVEGNLKCQAECDYVSDRQIAYIGE